MNNLEWAKLIYERVNLILDSPTYNDDVRERGGSYILSTSEVNAMFYPAKKLNEWLTSLDYQRIFIQGNGPKSLPWYEVENEIKKLYGITNAKAATKVEAERRKKRVKVLSLLAGAYHGKGAHHGTVESLHFEFFYLCSKWIINNAPPSRRFFIGDVRKTRRMLPMNKYSLSEQELSETLDVLIQ